MAETSPVRRMLQPVNNLIVINAETTGSILLRQNALFSELVQASVEQVKRLTESESLSDAMDQQRSYLQLVGTRVRQVTGENVESLRTAGREAGDIAKANMPSEQASGDAASSTPTASSSSAARSSGKGSSGNSQAPRSSS